MRRHGFLGPSQAMATASSSSSAHRRRGPYIPLITCPDCGKMVVRSVSGTAEHDGWTFYKCKTHGNGCVFWHWELEYVQYLVENDILRGDAAVDAIGWAEERREELELRQAEKEAVGAKGARVKQEKMIKNLQEAVDGLKEVLLALKIIIGLLIVMCVLALVSAIKK